MGAERNKPVVGFTSVVGDLFHTGHVAMIQECRLYCDYLIVGVMAGTADRENKNTPVQSLFERFYEVQNCSGVDRVIALGSEADLDLALRVLSPELDVRFVGDDYIGRDFTGKSTCEQYGIRIMYTHRRHGLSSTELRGRIANG
jgi:glycerol-3-phosphate cytidylyltransferase